MERMGFDRPDPNKPRGKYNNRKQTFDVWRRETILAIGKKYGLDIEEPEKHEERQYHRATRDFLAEQVNKTEQLGKEYAEKTAEVEIKKAKYEKEFEALMEKEKKIEDREVFSKGRSYVNEERTRELDEREAFLNHKEDTLKEIKKELIKEKQEVSEWWDKILSEQNRLTYERAELEKEKKKIGNLKEAEKWHKERTGRDIDDDDDPYERVLK